MYITPEDKKNAHVKVDGKGNLIVDIAFLYEGLPEEDRKEFLKHLAWTPDVFADIVEATLENYATSNYGSNIYALRKKLLEQSDVMERSFIRDLLSQMCKLQKDADLVRHNRKKLEEFATEINKHLPIVEKIKSPFFYETSDKYTLSEMVDTLVGNRQTDFTNV